MRARKRFLAGAKRVTHRPPFEPPVKLVYAPLTATVDVGVALLQPSESPGPQIHRPSRTPFAGSYGGSVPFAERAASPPSASVESVATAGGSLRLAVHGRLISIVPPAVMTLFATEVSGLPRDRRAGLVSQALPFWLLAEATTVR